MDNYTFTSKRARELYNALKTSGQWMTRNDLADATDKRRLSPNDVHQLEGLVSDGLIDRRDEPGAGTVGKTYAYRAR
jgi:predicted transcriptional regulator